MSEIRDPIHGFIALEECELEIINSPLFQRLRRIKQLALANLLYPGALHTRFEHSVGVKYVAERMGLALGLSDEERRWLRLTGLLHDLGHGPFSHVSEILLSRFAKPEIVQDQGVEEIHELITIQLIQHKMPLSDLDRERIIGIMVGDDKNKRDFLQKWGINSRQPDSLLKQIISGPLDSDKQDYLLRDSYFCGVKYGVFDMARLHNTLGAETDQRREKILAICEDGVHAVEQYVMAKYFLNTQVYRHHVRRTTDAMIVRALELGIEADKLPFLQKLYSYDGSDDFLNNYVQWDDERLTREILRHGAGKAYDIFQLLADRKLFKRIYEKKLEALPSHLRDGLINLSPRQKRETERKLGGRLGLDPDYVFLDIYTIKSAKEQVEGSEGSIRVKEGGSFEEESALFRSIDKAMKDQVVAIYGPAAYNSPRDKREKVRQWQEQVETVLEETLKGEGP